LEKSESVASFVPSWLRDAAPVRRRSFRGCALDLTGLYATLGTASSLGRTPKLTPHQQREAIRRRDNGETVRDIGRSYNVSHSTISRLTD
jgi:Helix-turn-helix domain